MPTGNLKENCVNISLVDHVMDGSLTLNSPLSIFSYNPWIKQCLINGSLANEQKKPSYLLSDIYIIKFNNGLVLK